MTSHITFFVFIIGLLTATIPGHNAKPIYPEERTIPDDILIKPGEIFVSGNYYAGSSSAPALLDNINGVTYNAYFSTSPPNCLFNPTYTSTDPIEASIDPDATRKRFSLKNTVQ